MALLNKLFSSKKKLDEGFSNSSIQTKVNSSTSSKTKYDDINSKLISNQF